MYSTVTIVVIDQSTSDAVPYTDCASRGTGLIALRSNTVWYVQVAALVIGHVVALTLAHDRALKVYDSVRHASRSQYFMLAVMVGFTCFGLFLLSQANA